MILPFFMTFNFGISGIFRKWSGNLEVLAGLYNLDFGDLEGVTKCCSDFDFNSLPKYLSLTNGINSSLSMSILFLLCDFLIPVEFKEFLSISYFVV